MLERLMSSVKEAFRLGVPNGSLLEWDRERLFVDLTKLVTAGRLDNGTDFNYAFCNCYYFYFPAEASESYEMATLEISFIADVYQIYWTIYKNRGFSGQVVNSPVNKESREWQEKVDALMQEKDFVRFPDEWSDLRVEGVRLELSENEEVTLAKCLFVDYED